MSIDEFKKNLVKNKQVVLSARIRPNAERNEIVGLMSDGSIKINLTAPATDNKANTALIKFLSREFGTAKITIIAGQTSRRKLVRLN